MKRLLITIIFLFISNIAMADAIVLKKLSHPVNKVGAETEIIISESGRIDYSTEISNGNRWEGFHVLTTVSIKDKRGNILYRFSRKNGINASYGGKTQVINKTEVLQIDKRFIPHIDKQQSSVTHKRVSGDFPTPAEVKAIYDVLFGS